jgi:hypothetical protein
VVFPAKKTTRVIFPLKKHTRAVFLLYSADTVNLTDKALKQTSPFHEDVHQVETSHLSTLITARRTAAIPTNASVNYDRMT